MLPPVKEQPGRHRIGGQGVMPVQMRMASRPCGARLSYFVTGQGPPLMLVAGLGASHEIWQPQVQELSRHFTLLMPDNRSIGVSWGPGLFPWIDIMAADALAVLGDAGYDEAFWCGMSMGGLIAQSVAAQAPETVRRLVLLCTAPRLGLPSLRGGLGARMLFGEDFVREEPATVAYWIAHGAPARPSVVLRQLVACLVFDRRHSAPGIKAPTLVLHGTDDRIVPVRGGRWLAAHIPGARLVEYDGAGHGVAIERPAKINAAITSFLEGGE